MSGAEPGFDPLHILIENAAKTISAAAALYRVPPSRVHDISNRAELGRALGRLNATISQVLSADIADREFALKGMAEQQEWFRANMMRLG